MNSMQYLSNSFILCTGGLFFNLNLKVFFCSNQDSARKTDGKQLHIMLSNKLKLESNFIQCICTVPLTIHIFISCYVGYFNVSIVYVLINRVIYYLKNIELIITKLHN